MNPQIIVEFLEQQLKDIKEKTQDYDITNPGDMAGRLEIIRVMCQATENTIQKYMKGDS